MRASKTVNGVTHYYTYDGLKLIREEWGNNTLVFLYDASGSPIGMQYRTTSYAEDVWDTYYYEKNLQGDVIAIYNASGTKLVSYTYDAWGYITGTSYYNGGANTSAVHNPLRYRGYYYDSDLDLYYLATRYYDPETCRFVTADDLSYLGATGDIVSYNLYAYCNNNPVMYVDPSGTFGGLGLLAISKELIVAIGAMIILISSLWNPLLEVAGAITSDIQYWFNSIEEEREAEKEKEGVIEDVSSNYWTASIINGVVTPGIPLTYSEAKQWAAAENDLLCKDHASAIAIVKFYPSSIWEPAHGGGLECGYLNHYHLSSAHKNHIWYYGE